MVIFAVYGGGGGPGLHGAYICDIRRFRIVCRASGYSLNKVRADITQPL